MPTEPEIFWVGFVEDALKDCGEGLEWVPAVGDMEQLKDRFNCTVTMKLIDEAIEMRLVQKVVEAAQRKEPWAFAALMPTNGNGRFLRQSDLTSVDYSETGNYKELMGRIEQWVDKWIRDRQGLT